MKRSRISFFALFLLLAPMIALQAQDVIITGVSSTPVSCGGGSDGTITVTVSGGVGNYSYLMIKGALPVEAAGPIASNTFTFSGHSKYNSYIIIVSDEDENTGDGFSYASIDGPVPIVITSYLATDITCNNVNDGSITVSASGEQGNYIFDLAGPLNQSNETGDFFPLPEGEYTVTVSDKNGCPSTDVTPMLKITNPTLVTVSEDLVTNVACFGDNTGSISITPGGGTPGGGSGYTYLWTGPDGFTSTSEDISNLESGAYSVTVFDKNMCSVSAGPINISEPPELSAILTGTTDVSCFEGNDGGASMTPGGGTGGYSYSWEGQATSLISPDQNPINLLADTYDFTLSDAAGCSKTFFSFATINEPGVIDATVISTIDVSCPGGSDGSADITPAGGTGPYNFAWSGNSTGYTSSDEDPSGMPSDDFNLTITDAHACSQVFAGILTITEPTPMTAAVNGTVEVTCFGEANGEADISISGGTPPYSVVWTGIGSGHSSSGETPGDLVADIYNVLVTDGKGCMQNFPGLVTITEPADITVTINNIVSVNCNGESTGEIEITPAGGTPSYTYSWSGPNGFTATTKDITNLEAGDYSLTITDANGCIGNFINLATIVANSGITGTFVNTNITCNGIANGAINASILGGTPAYTYEWTGPFGFSANTEDISGLVPGTYQLTVTDNLGCSQLLDPQDLIEPDAITATSTQVNIDCFGAANGSINLSSSGGVAPHLFSWTGPNGFTASTEDLSMLEPGSYSLSITDANGCLIPFPDIATILESSEIQVLPEITDISCNGLTDGSIGITVSGGNLPYIYAWSGPGGFVSSNEDISGLAAGTYDLSITDGNSCTLNFPGIGTINQPNAITAILSSQIDILCGGDASGSIEIDVSGGTSPLLFDWTNGAGVSVSTDEDPTGLPADNYSLSITDANGCNVSYPNMVILSEPPPLSEDLSKTFITCYGDENGTISVSASGGLPPYEYSRNNDLDPSYQPLADFTGLGPGFYTIWTRDANRCVVSDTVTIIEPEEIQVITEIKSGQVLCHGDLSGSISIEEVTGGFLPYEYSINNGIDFYLSNEFNNLPAGDYQTVIRDATGCEASGNLNVITEPSKLIIDSYKQEDITSCYDALEGRIEISGAGGFGAKTYILDNTITQITGDFQDLPGGPHIVRIEDQNGCTLDTSVVILSPPELVIGVLTLSHVSGCPGDATGAVSGAGAGGTGSITYSLDGGTFKGNGNFIGLLAGDHTLVVKDGNGCQRDTSFTILEPAPLSIDSELLIPISCAGAANGIIEILASGGTAPLNYTLNPGGASNPTGRFGNLDQGTYTVSVNDAEGCGPVISSPITLADPPVLVLDSVSYHNIKCNGGNDGEIITYVSGGIPPYEYSVDNGLTWSPDSIFSALVPGTYEVYARDANLCNIYGGSYTMTDPVLLTISVTSTDITGCYGDTEGIIEINSGGGTGTHAYSLDGISYTSSGLFANLSGGDYTSYVRDDGGCVVTQSLTINEPAQLLANIIKTDVSFDRMGSIHIAGTHGGTPPYEFTIGGSGGTFSADTIYNDLELDTYPVIVRDMNACTYEETVYILLVQPLEVEVSLTNVSCFGENDGIIEMVPQNAEGPVEYSIDNGASYQSTGRFEMLAGNTLYHLVARDSSGKTYTGTAPISQPKEIKLSPSITPAECNVFSETGVIITRASGGTPDYTYLWGDGFTEADRTEIGPGRYTLRITDANNCTLNDTFFVDSHVTVEAYAGVDTTICYGTSIQLDGQGGHTASWSPVDFLSNPDIANPMAEQVTETTSYILTITEENSPYGCFNIDTVTIGVYPLTGLEVTMDTFVVNGTSIQLEATGGPFSDYRWEPSTGLDNSTIPDPVATPQISTRYTVYALNDYGCEESDSIYLEVIDDIMAYNVFSPNGDGINDYFDIKNADRFPEVIVEVYNRWGDQFFSSKGYDDGKRWDGNARGNPAPMGTYYYVIIPYNGAKPITGNVTIIR